MAVRAQFRRSAEVGTFAQLTNSYCLTPLEVSPSFQGVAESVVAKHLPVVPCSVGNTTIVGRVTVGNRHGLLLPSMATDAELQHLRTQLPERVIVQRVEERLSALGNVVACNDYVALVHVDLDAETAEIIADTLQVEVFRATVGSSSLVGSYAVLTNQGGLVHAGTKPVDMEELSGLVGVPLAAGTVNRGSQAVGAGIVANDWAAICGSDTTATELGVVNAIFKLNGVDEVVMGTLQRALIDTNG